MVLSVMNERWEFPWLSLVALLASLCVVFYTTKLSFKSNSDFLDKEFEKERGRMGSKFEYRRIEGGLLAGVLVRLLIATEERLEELDQSGRASYNLKYAFAFLLWIPTSWFMSGIILFNWFGF